jgi:hypothetical protein
VARGSKQAENKQSTKLMKTLTIIFHLILFILNEVSKIRLNDDDITHLLLLLCTLLLLKIKCVARVMNNGEQDDLIIIFSASY